MRGALDEVHAGSRGDAGRAQAVRVIYIAGFGRSGSTVLDTVLGNHADTESVGELMYLNRAMTSDSEYCSCGEPARSCPFWAEVRARWLELLPAGLDASAWHRLQARFERTRSLISVLRARRRQGEDFAAYRAGVSALYRAIAELAEKEIIVDSSKSPVRALAIADMPGTDVRILHLVRDGRGCAGSLTKSYAPDPEAGIQAYTPGRPVWRSALRWLVVNRLSELALGAYPAGWRARIFYEDLVADPRRVLAEIAPVAGLDLAHLADRLEAGERLKPHHSIAGNRLRMSGGVVLKADEDWRRNLTAGQRRVFWLLAGRLARRYGYPRTPS